MVSEIYFQAYLFKMSIVPTLLDHYTTFPPYYSELNMISLVMSGPHYKHPKECVMSNLLYDLSSHSAFKYQGQMLPLTWSKTEHHSW